MVWWGVTNVTSTSQPHAKPLNTYSHIDFYTFHHYRYHFRSQPTPKISTLDLWRHSERNCGLVSRFALSFGQLFKQSLPDLLSRAVVHEYLTINTHNYVSSRWPYFIPVTISISTERVEESRMLLATLVNLTKQPHNYHIRLLRGNGHV